jgi:hypothetical protein
MANFSKNVYVEDISKDILYKSVEIPASDGILGGVAVTGFVDVEKLIHIYVPCYDKKTLFLEKKLPFSYLILSLDPPADMTRSAE